MPFEYESIEMDRQDATKRRPRKGLRGGTGGGGSNNDTCEVIMNAILCCWILDVLNN